MISYRTYSWATTFFLAFGIVLVAGGVALLVSGATSNGAALVIGVVGGVILSGFGAAFVAVAMLTRRPLQLTDATVRIPRGLHIEEIPISEIGGVGLVFKHTAPPARAPLIGWYLMIWTNDGREHITSVTWLPIRYRRNVGGAQKMTLSARGFDAVAGTDSDELSRTPAASVAKDLYQRVLKAQGSNGPLASQGLQNHPAHRPAAISPITAFWSPDRGLGRPGD